MFATKIAGKPYAGKPHVRIEEGESGVAIWLPSFSTLLLEFPLFEPRIALPSMLTTSPSVK